jgi:exodeoxyribonuclease VIII
MLDEKQLEERIVGNMSFEEYRAHPAVSQSDLKNLAKCPLYYKYKKENPCDTPALKTGRMIHTYILEQEKFEDEYFKTPKIRRVGKDWEEIQEKADGKEVVFEDELEAAKGMREMLLKLDFFKDSLAKSSKEASIFWQDDDTGINCKARIDGYSDWYNILYDLKTTRDCIEFKKSFFKYQYHIQASYYMDGIAKATGKMPQGFIVFAVEKEPPYLCRSFFIDFRDEILQIGRDEYKYLLNLYSECESKNNFEKAFEDEMDRIDYIPSWYNKLTPEEF